MPMPTNPLRRTALALIGLALALPAAAQPISSEQITAILASPDRTAADRTNDLRRKPQQMLEFFALRPGLVAVDLSAAGGYTTELVARAIGPTGAVYGQSRPPPGANAPRPAAPEGNSNPQLATPTPATPPRFRPSPEALAERTERMKAAGVPTAPITAMVRPFEDPFPPELAEGKVDVVTLIFNYHDLGHMQVDRAAMNRAAFRALKSGGTYIIADHAGRPGTGISEAGTLHRIDEQYLRAEIERAGFRFVAEAGFLRNPNDPRDRNNPDPPQPKDDFVMKFVKP